MSFVFEGIGTALNFIGGQKQAKAEKEAGRLEKLAADLEAAQLDQNAKQTVAAATYNAGRIRKKADEIMATARNEAAAAGAGLGGSYRDIAAKSVRESSLDQLLVMAEAEADAAKDRYEAKVLRETGKRREALSKRRASATLLANWGQTASSLGNMVDWKTVYGG